MRWIAGMLVVLSLVWASGCRSTYGLLFGALEKGYTGGGGDSVSRSSHFFNSLDEWERQESLHRWEQDEDHW